MLKCACVNCLFCTNSEYTWSRWISRCKLWTTSSGQRTKATPLKSTTWVLLRRFNCTSSLTVVISGLHQLIKLGGSVFLSFSTLLVPDFRWLWVVSVRKWSRQRWVWDDWEYPVHEPEAYLQHMLYRWSTPSWTENSYGQVSYNW